MVSTQEVQKQVRKLGFNIHGWGRSEVRELHNILIPEEQIFELVNGLYEGGFALLVATDVRVLLVDKKPLNYLTVEDLRFDMINEMDYSHRLIGAQINIATGNKTLKFSSVNQPRLRKLIGHVQHSMAEAKKQQNGHQEDQKQHLEQIKHQLQSYLMAQQQQQMHMQQIQLAQQTGVAPPPMPEPIKPSPELADFLLAQSLLAQHQQQTGASNLPIQPELLNQAQATVPLPPPPSPTEPNPSMNELYAEGMQEIFGRRQAEPAATPVPIPPITAAPPLATLHHNPLEINPMKIASAKLPMALRNRKFGRPSFHAHSEAPLPTPQIVAEL